MILVYTRSKEKTESIINLCKMLGEETKNLSPSCLNKSIKELIAKTDGNNSIAGKTGDTRKTVSFSTSGKVAPLMYVMQDVLIFAGVQDKKLDVFLDEYKRAGIEPVKLKAIVTPFNMNWSLYELIEQLKLEAK